MAIEIIESKHNHAVIRTYKVTCPHCGSTLKFDTNDIEYYGISGHLPHIKCPICNLNILFNEITPILVK